MKTSADFVLTQVSKRFVRGGDAVTVFDKMSLVINGGSFVALMGPSGSGKSTLLNLMAGMDRPDSGEITFCGDRIDTLSSRELAVWRARNVGFVFQSYNLLPMLSAERNIELPLTLTRLAAAERRRRVGLAMELVGITACARRLPAQLSGGQQQRVAIARAIVADAPVLLCDEPTGNLDRIASDDVLRLLQTLNQELGKTIVVVTHDSRAAEAAQRILRLDKGQFVDAVANA